MLIRCGALGIPGGATGSVDRVATTHVGSGSVGSDGLEATGHATVSDVSTTKIVHRSGVRPEGGDSGVGVVHALVGTSHVHGSGTPLHGVSKPVLGRVSGGDCSGAEVQVVCRVGSHTARADASARGELLEVVDSLEHCSVYEAYTCQWEVLCSL